MVNMNHLLGKLNYCYMLLTENLPLYPSNIYGGFEGRLGMACFAVSGA